MYGKLKMTRNEAVSLVQQNLGFKNALSSTIITNMQAQQQQLELSPTKPWFLLSENSFTNTTVGVRRVALPSDFLDEYEEGCLHYDRQDSTEPECLSKDTYERLAYAYRNERTGEPKAYSLDGNYFNIFPLPDGVYKIQMKYYKKGASLTTNIENEWLKHIPLLLVGKVGLVVAEALRDTGAVPFFKSMVQESLLLLENQNEARKHSNYELQMGGPH